MRAVANRLPGFTWFSQHSELLSWVRQLPTDVLTAAHARVVGADEQAWKTRALTFAPGDLESFEGEIRWLHHRLPQTTKLGIVFVPSAEAFDRTRADADVVTAKSAQIVQFLRKLTSDMSTPFLDVAAELAQWPKPERLFFA